MRIASNDGALKESPTILCVGLTQEEQAVLRYVIRDVDCLWKLHRDPDTLPQLISTNNVAVVVFDDDFHPGLWKEHVPRLLRQENAPPVVLTSRLADERLWAEALNLGAYDLLMKPFERAEAARVLQLAFLRSLRTQVPTIHRKVAVA